MAKAKKKKNTKRTPQPMRKPPRKRPGRKGATKVSDNIELIEWVATWVRAGRTRWECKRKIIEWFEDNMPARLPISPTTRETIMRNANAFAEAKYNEFRADLLTGLTKLHDSFSKDPEFNPAARVRAAENVAELHGVGSKFGQTDAQHSPEAKAERARRALREMDDAVAEEETE